MGEDDNKLKITCQICKVFVTCYGKSGELLYTTSIHDGMYTIGIDPEG